LQGIGTSAFGYDMSLLEVGTRWQRPEHNIERKVLHGLQAINPKEFLQGCVLFKSINKCSQS
jgi:hypothetical protein